MSDSLDVVSGIALGVFLLTVVVKGNSPKLVELALRDKGFVKWAIAIGILFYLRDIPEMKGPVTLLIAAAFIGLFLLTGSQIAAQASTFWESLGASVNKTASQTSTPADLIAGYTGK
jgi:hypothetical protein